jgi:hypothetical protein
MRGGRAGPRLPEFSGGHLERRIGAERGWTAIGGQILEADSHLPDLYEVTKRRLFQITIAVLVQDTADPPGE